MMKKRSKILLFAIGLFTVWGVVFYSGFRWQRRWDYKKYVKELEVVKKPYSIEFTPEGEFCVVDNEGNKPLLVSNLTEALYLEYRGREYNIPTVKSYMEYDQYDIVVYDTHTMQEVRRISMLEMLSPYLEKYRSKSPRIFFAKDFLGIEEKWEFVMFLFDKETEKEEAFYIDFDRKQLHPVGERKILYEEESVDDSYTEEAWLYNNTDLLYNGGFLRGEIYYFSLKDAFADNTYQMNKLELQGNELPSTNWMLYTIFPKLKDAVGNRDKEVHIYLKHADNNRLTQLIMNDGEEPDLSKLYIGKEWYNGEQWVKEENYGTYYKDGKLTPIKDEDLQSFLEGYREYIRAQEESTAAQ